MKKIITLTTLCLMITMMLMPILAFQNQPPKPKNYKLEYSEQQWISKVRLMQECQEALRKSTYPAYLIANMQDSLQALIADINNQIGAQIRDTTVTPVDSTLKKQTKK